MTTEQELAIDDRLRDVLSALSRPQSIAAGHGDNREMVCLDPLDAALLRGIVKGLLEGRVFRHPLGFERLLPPHKAELLLVHAPHTVNYETVEQYIARTEDMQRGKLDWVADGEHERAIAANDLWYLQWYPDTPVGSYCFYAASFGALVARLEREGWKR